MSLIETIYLRKNPIEILLVRLNIGTRYASSSIIVDEVMPAPPPVAPVSQRQRNKRARREIDNDETEMVNGH